MLSFYAYFRPKIPVIIIFGVLIYTCCLSPESKDLSTTSLSSNSTIDLNKGKDLFIQQCARCHGVHAEGGNGPSLKRAVLRNAPTDEALINLIQFGIPGTEMPGNWMLSSKDATLVAEYVKTLGQSQEVLVAGNIENGKKIFETTGACRSCHVVNGAGITVGPELSNVGNRRGPDFIRKVLMDPGFFKKEGDMVATESGFIDYLVYRVVDQNGKELIGMRLNEDAFTIQLKDIQNNHYSLRKSNLKSIQKEFGKSFMPSLKGVLSNLEIDDLVAYLSSLKQSHNL